MASRFLTVPSPLLPRSVRPSLDSALYPVSGTPEEGAGLSSGIRERTAANGEGRWAGFFRFRKVLFFKAFSPFVASPSTKRFGDAAFWGGGGFSPSSPRVEAPLGTGF